MKATLSIRLLGVLLFVIAMLLGCSQGTSETPPPPQQATVPKHDLRWSIEYKNDEIKFVIWNNSKQDFTGIKLSITTPTGNLYWYHDPRGKYEIPSGTILSVNHNFFSEAFPDDEEEGDRFPSDGDISMMILESDQGFWKLNPPSGLYQKI